MTYNDFAVIIAYKVRYRKNFLWIKEGVVMKQVEMSRYLKFITIGVGVLFLVFVIWFLPSVMRDLVYEAAGPGIYRGACISRFPEKMQ